MVAAAVVVLGDDGGRRQSGHKCGGPRAGGRWPTVGARTRGVASVADAGSPPLRSAHQAEGTVSCWIYGPCLETTVVSRAVRGDLAGAAAQPCVAILMARVKTLLSLPRLNFPAFLRSPIGRSLRSESRCMKPEAALTTLVRHRAGGEMALLFHAPVRRIPRTFWLGPLRPMVRCLRSVRCRPTRVWTSTLTPGACALSRSWHGPGGSGSRPRFRHHEDMPVVAELGFPAGPCASGAFGIGHPDMGGSRVPLPMDVHHEVAGIIGRRRDRVA